MEHGFIECGSVLVCMYVCLVFVSPFPLKNHICVLCILLEVNAVSIDLLLLFLV